MPLMLRKQEQEPAQPSIPVWLSSGEAAQDALADDTLQAMGTAPARHYLIQLARSENKKRLRRGDRSNRLICGLLLLFQSFCFWLPLIAHRAGITSPPPYFFLLFLIPISIPIAFCLLQGRPAKSSALQIAVLERLCRQAEGPDDLPFLADMFWEATPAMSHVLVPTLLRLLPQLQSEIPPDRCRQIMHYVARPIRSTTEIALKQSLAVQLFDTIRISEHVDLLPEVESMQVRLRRHLKTPLVTEAIHQCWSVLSQKAG